MFCMGLLVGGARLQAQGPAAAPAAEVKVPGYDVVSIKPDRTESGRVSVHIDIKAKIVNPDRKQLEAMTFEQFRSMQQPILTDRFALTFHREMKTLPVYELVTTKGGPKFKDATPAELQGHQGIGVHNHNLDATVEPISALVEQLSGQLQRVVVDKTGLTGRYSFKLSWSPDDAGPPSPDVAAPPDIFTALQEQLGLKLQPGKAEIDTFVVDHAELPAAD